MSKSEDLFARARRVSPGGVHSPVRAFKGVGGTPRFMTGGNGALIRDVDGRELIDFCMAFGPLILGHGNRAVGDAAVDAIELLARDGLTQRVPAHLESWTALCRAGASMIISYGAREARQWLSA